jgi:hypothetical protein
MKKIFTFLFFAGLMTTAMAQNGNYGQHRSQQADSHNQPNVYANNSQSTGGYSQSNGGYRQPQQADNGYQQSNRYNQNNGYAHENDRRFDNRGNDRRFHDNDRYDRHDYGYDRRREYERPNHGRFSARISIRFGQPSCF